MKTWRKLLFCLLLAGCVLASGCASHSFEDISPAPEEEKKKKTQGATGGENDDMERLD